MTLINQPDDIIRHVCTFLKFIDMLRLGITSKRFNKVNEYITDIGYKVTKEFDGGYDLTLDF